MLPRSARATPAEASWAVRALAAGVLALAAPAPRALAAEVSGAGHAEVGGGYDSNASREVDASARADGVLLGVAQLEGAVAAEDLPVELSAHYDLGAKHFLTLHDEDLVAQAAAVEGILQLGEGNVGLSGRVKDRRSRGGDRDYTDLGAALGGGLRLGRTLPRLEVGVERFLYRPDPTYRYAGPDASLQLAIGLAPHHRLTPSLLVALHDYDAASALAGGAPRHDRLLSAALVYRYKGPVVASAGYSFLDDSSDQLGRSYQRHRVDGSLAFFVPLELAVVAGAAIQRTRFPDGVAVAPELLLTSDDENTDSATLSISRALAHGLQVELRGAGYLADFSTNGLHYHRATAQLTLSWDG